MEEIEVYLTKAKEFMAAKQDAVAMADAVENIAKLIRRWREDRDEGAALRDLLFELQYSRMPRLEELIESLRRLCSARQDCIDAWQRIPEESRVGLMPVDQLLNP